MIISDFTPSLFFYTFQTQPVIEESNLECWIENLFQLIFFEEIDLNK